MLRLSDIDAGYGDAHVLKGVSIEVGDREIVTVMGPNGAGKSTLLRTIAGGLRPRGGEVRWEDEVVTAQRAKHAVRRGIVLVPEGRHIFKSLTVRENLALGAYIRRDRREVAADIALMYDLFPVLAKKADHSGGAMSGGEQQMLAIARGLMSRPKLLLLDEPSLGLAPIIIHGLPDVLRRVADAFGTGILLVEQNSSLALSLASRGYLLEAGRIVFTGDAAAIGELIRAEGPFLGTRAGAVPGPAPAPR